MTSVYSPWINRGIVFGVALAGATIVAFFAPPWLHGTVRLVAEYDAAATLALIGYFILAFRSDQRLTEMRAAIDDPGRNIVLGVVLLSIAAGLSGAVLILGKGTSPAAVALAIYAAVVGWLLTHATFALRYAHLFYWNDGRPENGLTFPGTESPDDYDFLYFSFVIGMTFQVSDVQINDPRIRRLALVHGLVSFVYNTAILALGVNLISNLLH